MTNGFIVLLVRTVTPSMLRSDTISLHIGMVYNKIHPYEGLYPTRQWVEVYNHWEGCIFTATTVVAGRQCFHKHVSFLLSTGRGGVSASRGEFCLGGLHPGGSAGGVCIQGDWADPPIVYYGIRSTSRRYTSYWNAFLCCASFQRHVLCFYPCWSDVQ